MALIEFKDLPDTTTPLTASNLNNNFNECYNIVESGSNANGRYIKYSDGTMITSGVLGNFAVDITSSWGNMYYGNIPSTCSFPQEFLEAPYVIWDIIPTTGTGCFKINYEAPTITTQGISGLTAGRPSSASNVSVKVHIIAVGKWK